MGLSALDCPKCGARLKASIGVMTCEYCGTQVQPQPKSTQAPRPSGEAATQVGADAVVRPIRAGRIIFFTLVMIVGTTAFSIWMVLRSLPDLDVVVPALEQAFTQPQGGANAPQIPSIPGLPTIEDGAIKGLPGDVAAMWDDVGGIPRLATVAGKEAVIGRLRTRGSDELFYAAFAGDTGELLYYVGPLGTYSEAYRSAHAAVAGKRLAVSDGDAHLRLVDLDSGAEVKVLPFSDRIERLCTDDDRLFARIVDRREFAVDTASGELTEAKIPSSCGDTSTRTLGIPTEGDRKALRRAPDVKGFEATGLHVDGDVMVVNGHRNPGTEVPMAVGVDPKTKAVKWKIEVPAIDPLRAREASNQYGALAGGRFFTPYGEGDKAWHLAAFDAQTGARLWDTTLRAIFAVDHLSGVIASESHVYVVRMSSLEIYDAATGALQHTIGGETYE